MSEAASGADFQLSDQTPLYVSKRSFKNLWQQYRIYPDRVELQCWIAFHTLKITLQEIVNIRVKSSFSFSDFFRKESFDVRAIKIDQSDLYRHVVIAKKSGLMKRVVFTPDRPDEFADIIKLLMDKADQIRSIMENNG